MRYYYAALSADGFIAGSDPQKPVAWLDQFNQIINDLPANDRIKTSYDRMIKDTKVVVMGRQTYDDILSFGVPWPYEMCETYVVSHNLIEVEHTQIKFVNYQEVTNLLKTTRQQVLILGGGNLAGQLIDDNLVDKIVLTQMPILLGSGIRFWQNQQIKNLSLERVEQSNNFIELEYQIKESKI